MDISHVQGVLAIIGTPIVVLFGWVHAQLRGLKGDIGKKASIDQLQREVDNSKENFMLRHEQICARLDSIEAHLNKFEDKLDRLLEHRL